MYAACKEIGMEQNNGNLIKMQVLSNQSKGVAVIKTLSNAIRLVAGKHTAGVTYTYVYISLLSCYIMHTFLCILGREREAEIEKDTVHFHSFSF